MLLLSHLFGRGSLENSFKIPFKEYLYHLLPLTPVSSDFGQVVYTEIDSEITIDGADDRRLGKEVVDSTRIRSYLSVFYSLSDRRRKEKDLLSL